MITLLGTRFGAIDYDEADLLCFGEGLIGFPDLTLFVLLSLDPQSPFRWLQSVEDPAIAFLLAHPEKFVQDYTPSVSNEVAASLALKEETPKILFTTASIPPGQPQEMTLNLAAPIVVNAITRSGKQVVLEEGAYTIKYRVFPEANRVSGRVAA